MKKLKLWHFAVILGVVLIIVYMVPYCCITIKVHGDQIMEVDYAASYQELGAEASFFGKKLQVTITGKVDTSKLATQTVQYAVKNKLGVVKKEKRIIKIVDRVAPKLTLQGENVVTIRQGEKYIDPGYTLIDNVEGDISKRVVISGKVNSDKIGTYELKYVGKDSFANASSAKRTVKVIAKEISYIDAYDNIDNSARTWWSGNKKDNKIPLEGAAATKEELKKYQAYYLGPDDKVIYLTFDEGSNDTYVKEIMEVLNNNQVKGTFFFCGNYVVTNPEVMKALVKSGHSVGNHTYHHKSMYQYATRESFQQFIQEIRDVETAFYDITGTNTDKVYREPRGDWSYRDLQIVKDMGYKTFFWSADYYDFAGTTAKEIALTSWLQKYHNGAIYLIHPKNKGNYEALDDFIKEMKKRGYRFDLVKNIT